MNRAQRKELNLQHPMISFLEVSGINVALIVVGSVMLAAEAWLFTIGTPVVFVVALLALTGFTVATLAKQVWEDWR